MTNMERLENIGVLFHLPPEQVNEVADFAKMLKNLDGLDDSAGFSDEWTQEDCADATRFAMEYGYAGL